MDMKQDGMAVEDQEHCLPVDGLQGGNHQNNQLFILKAIKWLRD